MIDFEYCRYKLNNQIGTYLVGWMIKLMFFCLMLMMTRKKETAEILKFRGGGHFMEQISI